MIQWGSFIPVIFDIQVKKAVLEFDFSSENQYKTPFTEDVMLNGTVSYQVGGKVSLSSTISLKGGQLADSKESYKLDADLLGYEDVGVYKRSFDITIFKKDVSVKDII